MFPSNEVVIAIGEAVIKLKKEKLPVCFLIYRKRTLRIALVTFHKLFVSDVIISRTWNIFLFYLKLGVNFSVA